jgi:subtilisin-like proprotein convertase family protein
MIRPSIRGPRRVVALLAVVTSAALVAGVTAEVASAERAHRSHHAVTAKTLPSKVFSFTGTNTGAIPDATGTPNNCNQTEGTRDVSFVVSGAAGPITDVSVTMVLAHTWGSDVIATLIAPGGSPTSPIMLRPTSPSAPTCGSGNDFNGTYTFNDQATLNIWTALTAGNPASGAYRATGPFVSTPINLTAAFASVANPNGTWILRMQDKGTGDTGTISGATLNLTAKDPAPCTAATAKTAAAQGALGTAASKASSAAAALDKAKAKLKKAKASGNPAKIKKAKKRVKAAKASKKAADAAVVSAQAALAAAQAAQSAVC